jgi:hypothetical protein
MTLVDQMMEHAEADMPVTRELALVLLEYMALFDKKQHDYGSQNIAAFGEKGLIVRQSDKLARLRHLVWDLEEESRAEPIEDAWWDMLGYSAIAILVHRGVWDG